MAEPLDIGRARAMAAELQQLENPEALRAGAWIEALCKELEEARKDRARSDKVIEYYAELVANHTDVHDNEKAKRLEVRAVATAMKLVMERTDSCPCRYHQELRKLRRRK